MKHTACTHPATPAGRAACRKGNPAPVAPEGDVKRLARKAGLKVDNLDGVTGVRFEKETCMRCAGSGTYPSSCWNGICLGCSGSGVRFTRNGAAAYKRYWTYVREHNTVKVGELVAGDQYEKDNGRWVTAHEIIRGDFGDVTCTIGVKGSGTEVVTVTKHDAKIVTKTKEGREIHNITSSEQTVVRRPNTEGFYAAVGHVAHLKGTILVRKDEANA